MASETVVSQETFIFSADPERMNWLRPDFPYAALRLPDTLTGTVQNRREGDRLYTEIVLTNPSEKPLFTGGTEIAVSFPLEDRYDASAVCMRSRCHAHIFCGGGMSYICALRMGGGAPHLGMVLTEGAFSGYSVERDAARSSNDRGCFWLHPAALTFAPHETKRLAWVVFPHAGGGDFWTQAAKLTRCVRVESSEYVLFPGERAELTIEPLFPALCVRVDGAALQAANGVYTLPFTADAPGERVFRVEADGLTTWCRVFVHADIASLAENRCRFIARHQQYTGPLAALEGAYLTYDNEEERQVYRTVRDYNGGRERVGMALLTAKYLQLAGVEKNEALERGLQRYVAFAERELLCPETGYVYDDIGRDASYLRLYDFPWFALLYVELYDLYKKADYLLQAYRIVQAFYGQGGERFYPIELPLAALYEALRAEKRGAEADDIRTWAVRHADTILAVGTDYPPSEVNYEQSIVAPAADILLQTHQITGDARYLEGAREQVQILELFNGHQPDYHCYETAIRHWDGYWFGKYKLFGDTFPHYWSALTGVVFAQYAAAAGEREYERRARASLRGVLPLLFADGRASCAYVFPQSVNGTRAALYDPFANDQDWGLYFYLRAFGLAEARI